MLELLITILVFLWKGVKNIIKYTFPVIFCIVSVGGGIILGAFTVDRAFDKHMNEIKSNLTHTVTICWDESGSSRTKLQVREDVNWNINGVLSATNRYVDDPDFSSPYHTDDNPYYYIEFMDKNQRKQDKSLTQYQFVPTDKDENDGMYNLPAEAQKTGWKFLGLFTSPYGGTQFVNSAGYSVRTITMDLELYAVWEKI